VYHTSDVNLSGKTDEEVFAWAQRNDAFIISFDEDFADGHSLSVRDHHGIVRLRVWPTTIEETDQPLARLFNEVSAGELAGSLVIVDRSRIRVRSRPK
jgi:predicted nuclease of predicted toxin-antitoxin system